MSGSPTGHCPPPRSAEAWIPVLWGRGSTSRAEPKPGGCLQRLYLATSISLPRMLLPEGHSASEEAAAAGPQRGDCIVCYSAYDLAGHLPRPPPPNAAQHCPASCLATRICAHSYSTATHNRKAFWLPPGCCLLFSTRFRHHLLQETCQDPHKLSALKGPTTPWLSHCVRVHAELSRCLFIPSVFPSQGSPTRRPVSTGVERPPRNSQHRALWKAPGAPSEATSPWHTPGRGPRASLVA